MGLAYLAPIGMQNLFVINSALNDSRKRAFLTAIIVACFDISLSLSCFYGIGSIMEKYDFVKLAILLIGSIVVIKIGISLLKSRAENVKRDKSSMPIGKTITSACVVTWFNPQAIIDGTMMLGAFHVTLLSSQALPFMSGIISASFLWFTGLIFIISIFSKIFRGNNSSKIMTAVNRVCGIVIIIYGLNLLKVFFTMLA
ncbi:MAG: LysE family transporter [Succinivibrio sp.]|nr:LysE family transporter [Succinivibrio sp.]MDD6377867.1 LysE family transporter [Succinatimonas sp.]MDY5994234.1 LysE family transporter [Succinivibrio sp.]